VQEIEIKLNKEQQRITMDTLITELNNVTVALAHLNARKETNNETYKMFKHKQTILKEVIKMFGRG